MGEKIIKHLTLADRSQIEASIKNGASQTAIAKCLGKNKTCVGKEIMKHREKRNGTIRSNVPFSQSAAIRRNVLD